jgi:hypothetical protein
MLDHVDEEHNLVAALGPRELLHALLANVELENVAPVGGRRLR